MSDAPPDLVTTARRLITHWVTRYVVCWLACLGVAFQRGWHAYHSFDTVRTQPEREDDEQLKVRADGNSGHTWIDFGGQYVFGRTAAEGRWRDLYHRDGLRQTADASYPIERQSDAVVRYHDCPDRRPDFLKPDDVKPDADHLLRSMMGDDVEDKRNARLGEVVGAAFAGTSDNPFATAAWAVESNALVEEDEQSDSPLLGRPVLGGPLYPPVHAILYAPLGMVKDSQLAYHLFQLFSLVSVFGSGLAVRAISRGRVWWPVATTLLLLFPGMRPGLDLGQNHALTLFIVLAGWAVAARWSQFGGGMVWGLLAFKPVWGVAFILAPILLRKWKFVFGVGVCGCSLCLATLPLVGIEGWKEWLHIGGEAADLYNRDENWIHLSRDVSGLPKRFYVDFNEPRATRTPDWVNRDCNLLLATIGLVTAGVGLLGGGTARRLWRVVEPAEWPVLRHGPPLWLPRLRSIRVLFWLIEVAGRVLVWLIPVVGRVLVWFLVVVGRMRWLALFTYFLRGYGLRFTGLRAGFVLLGSYLCCYRFMYYDAVMASVGFAALLAFPRWTLTGWRGELREVGQPASGRRAFLFASSAPLTILLLLLLADNAFLNSGGAITLANDNELLWLTDPCGGTQTKKGEGDATVTGPKMKWTPRQVSIRLDYNHALDTYLVLAAWGWCGWRLLRSGRRTDRLSTRDPPSA